MLTQTGTVTAASPTSVTVRSAGRIRSDLPDIGVVVRGQRHRDGPRGQDGRHRDRDGDHRPPDTRGAGPAARTAALAAARQPRRSHMNGLCQHISHNLCPCSPPADSPHDALPGASAAQLRRAAGAGVVPDVRLTSLTFEPLDSLLERNPRPPQAVIDAKAAELDLDKPIPVRYASWVSGAVRGDFGTTVTGQPVVRRTVAAHRGQPAAGGHRLGARHGRRRGRRRVGRDPPVPAVRPGHHGAVAAGAQHADVRGRQPADPRRAAR